MAARARAGGNDQRATAMLRMPTSGSPASPYKSSVTAVRPSLPITKYPMMLASATHCDAIALQAARSMTSMR